MKKKTVKAWITVSDYGLAPTTYGEYWTRRPPKNYTKIVHCTITYQLNNTK